MECFFDTKLFTKTRTQFRKYLIFIIIYFIQMKIISCESCKDQNSISNKECFNNIFIFNDKKYRAGQFAKNKNGDIVLEYSIDQSRLFFGLKADGSYFFDSQNHVKTIESINTDENVYLRYESKSLFVSLESDITKSKEYLLSISTFKALAELHDLENNNYLVRKSENFVGNQIFSYHFSILESQINSKNIYFFIYIHSNETEGNLYTIKKFGFTDFNLNSYDDITYLTLEKNLNNRILSSFIIDEEQLIVIFFIKITQRLAVSFFDFNLNPKGEDQEIHNLKNIKYTLWDFFQITLFAKPYSCFDIL